MIRKITFLSLAIAFAVVISGCHSNTTEGIGRDVQKLGEKIEG